MLESKIYILGAGCSKHCGYPLGPQMKEDLETFGRSLDSATSPRLQKAVAETVALMGGEWILSIRWFNSFTAGNLTHR
jgi:hypothetical protein